MKGVIFRGNREIELRTFEDPTPGYGETVIEMKASGLCGSDLHYYRNDPIEVAKSFGLKDTGDGAGAAKPIIGGHEPCGIIQAVGQGVDPRLFKPGDRVIVYHYIGCGACDHCRTGWDQMCDNGPVIHGVSGHGGHANLMRVPAANLVHLPDELSFMAGAAVACGTGTAFNALARLDASARDTIAIFGLGPVGLSLAQLAHAMGLEVFGIDINADRIAGAHAFGVTHAIDASRTDPVEEILRLTRGKGVTCAVDCAGGDAAKTQAVRSTAAWGRIALVAANGSLNVEAMRDMIGKQRTVFGSWTFSKVGMKRCAKFIADHGVETDRIFSDIWSLDRAEDAYRVFDKQSGGKGVFVF